MYYYIAYQSLNGPILNLHSNDTFIVKSIKGLGVDANNNINKTSGHDGGQLISSVLPTREIRLEIILNNRYEEQQIMSTFLPKQIGTFYYSDKKISCYVQSVDVVKLTAPVTANIVLQCPNPYFTSLTTENVTMALTEKLLEFPMYFDEINGNMLSNQSGSVFKTIENKSTVNVYPIVTFYAKSNVTNPSLMNIHTYEKMEVIAELSAGESVVIDTRTGMKSVTKYSGYNDVGINYFNNIADDFKFFPLYVGNNKLKFDADGSTSGLEVTVSYDTLYGGL